MTSRLIWPGLETWRSSSVRARGLTQAVLETIRTQVFNVAAPTP